MKNWINKIGRDKFQRYLFIGVLILVFGVFFISLSLLDTKKPTPPDDGKGPDITNPDDKDPDTKEPVIVYETIKMPVATENYEVVKKFWSKDASTADQVAALICFGSTYSPSKGISIGNKTNPNENFSVVASVSGTVKKVTDSPIYGKEVVIKHKDGLEFKYNSLSNVAVTEGAEVKQGDIIGTSGVSEYDSSVDKTHVHFQVTLNGKQLDPLSVVNKKTNEIK